MHDLIIKKKLSTHYEYPAILTLLHIPIRCHRVLRLGHRPQRDLIKQLFFKIPT